MGYALPAGQANKVVSRITFIKGHILIIVFNTEKLLPLIIYP